MKTYKQTIQIENNDATLHTALCLPYGIDSFSLEVEYVYYPAEQETCDNPYIPACVEIQGWKLESFETNGIDVIPTTEQRKFLMSELEGMVNITELAGMIDEAAMLEEQAEMFRLETRGV